MFMAIRTCHFASLIHFSSSIALAKHWKRLKKINEDEALPLPNDTNKRISWKDFWLACEDVHSVERWISSEIRITNDSEREFYFSKTFLEVRRKQILEEFFIVSTDVAESREQAVRRTEIDWRSAKSVVGPVETSIDKSVGVSVSVEQVDDDI